MDMRCDEWDEWEENPEKKINCMKYRKHLNIVKYTIFFSEFLTFFSHRDLETFLFFVFQLKRKNKLFSL